MTSARSVADRVRARIAAGDRVGAWASLVAAGDLRAAPEVLRVARALAETTMRTARRDVETIVERLKRRGYRFIDETAAYVAPSADVTQELDAMEAELGPLPVSLRATYEFFGACNLMGQDPSWPRPACVALPGVSEVSGESVWLTDPLVVAPLEQVRAIIADGDEEDVVAFPISGDAMAKAGYSAGVLCVRIPDGRADAELEGDPTHPTFVEYFRHSLLWGGFPGARTIPQLTQWARELSRGLEAI